MNFSRILSLGAVLALPGSTILHQNSQAAPAGKEPNPAWPQPYAVRETRRALALRTPYYTVEHDLKRGGAISRIVLTHGTGTNLLVSPVETRVLTGAGLLLSDAGDSAPLIKHRKEGNSEIVAVEAKLEDAQGRPSGLSLKTIYEYRWGCIKIRKELQVESPGINALEIAPISTVLHPSLTDYGYREGTSEAEGAPPYSFGSNKWGRMEKGGPPLATRFTPRSVLFANPGIEGLEWFAGSDLAQWETQCTGRRGDGRFSLKVSTRPTGIEFVIMTYASTNSPLGLTQALAFNCYLGLPISDGRARSPWLHTSFNRNRGNWVSATDIQAWAAQGIQTVHCHNDGDYFDDGLFWRDGSYPPYPDMERYDQVLRECRKADIRTATYFSNKELHPSTQAFIDHGRAWGRMNQKHELQHNFFRGQSEFGAQMCLRSGWLEFLKSSIDRVLKNHPLDGVYYDWNVALYCCNPLHEGRTDPHATASGHWDIDELLDLMEWTRQRVGPTGLVILHNTTTPVYAFENFADHIVATEWGYRKWKDQAAALEDLPLEWSLAGARSRGVISYGTIEPAAPRRLHRVFALEAFLGGVAPWPASPETFQLLPVLKPLGDPRSFRFADWRNSAVVLSDAKCGAAVYSRPGEAYVFLANLDQAPREITCRLLLDQLPYPLGRPKTARIVSPSPHSTPNLMITDLTGAGSRLRLEGDSAMLIQIR